MAKAMLIPLACYAFIAYFDFIGSRHCGAVGRGLPLGANAARFLLFPAMHEPPWISRHVRAGKQKLERRTNPPPMASLPRLNGVTTS